MWQAVIRVIRGKKVKYLSLVCCYQISESGGGGMAVEVQAVRSTRKPIAEAQARVSLNSILFCNCSGRCSASKSAHCKETKLLHLLVPSTVSLPYFQGHILSCLHIMCASPLQVVDKSPSFFVSPSKQNPQISCLSSLSCHVSAR